MKACPYDINVAILIALKNDSKILAGPCAMKSCFAVPDWFSIAVISTVKDGIKKTELRRVVFKFA